MADDVIRTTQINSAGFGTISKLAMQDRRLHIAAKAIYAYFNSFAGCGDCCFPSRKKICYDLDISNDTLGKYLRQLSDYGYIKIEQIKVNGRFSHNLYILCDTILPYPKISDTEDFVHGNLDTNINSYKNNSLYNINRDIIRQTDAKDYSKVTLNDKEREELIHLSDGLTVEAYLKKIIDWQTQSHKICSKPYILIKQWIEEDRPKKKQSKRKNTQNKDTSYDLNEWEQFAMNFDPT